MTHNATHGSSGARPDDCKTDKFLGDYLHVCPRTGDLLDEYDQDFRHCRCFQPTQELLALQDAINVRLDAERGR